MQKRTAAIFIDGSNFYQQCRDYLGDTRVDFTKLRDWVSQRLNLDVVRVYYYNAELPKKDPGYGKQQKFFDALRHSNFIVVRLGMIIERHGGSEEKMVDTRICSDMMHFSFMKSYNSIVLFSGDQDLAPPLHHCKDYGTTVYVASFVRACSPTLSNVADFVLKLDKSTMRPLVFRSEGAPVGAEGS